MLIRIGSNFRINDYNVSKNHLYIETNVKPNFDILRQSGSLIVNKETDGLVKTAKLIVVSPRSEDFCYIRNRAVSAGNVLSQSDGSAQLIPIDTLYQQFPRYNSICRGANDNGDFFSHEELLNSYKTFIGKPVFVDHDNENVEKARGIILDAIYNERGYFVELLKAVDRKAYPALVRAIEMGYATSTSMGCRCGFSICSICGHQAHTEDEFCDHIKNYKASTFNDLAVWEDNRDVSFIESSLVSIPADSEARILQKIASVARCARGEKNQYNNIKLQLKNELNQRIYGNRVKSIFEELNNLPWS